MKRVIISLCLSIIAIVACKKDDMVVINKDNSGFTLRVNGENFIVNGMNWDYIPRGLNTVNANFWEKPDEIIKEALEAEMSLLKEMGVNAIRQYTGVPARWISYIYENYGIYTMLNHSFGRYGLTIDGKWVPITDYDDQKTQQVLEAELTQLVLDYKDTPGLLLYLLGNENNYGLFWAGSETEDFPDDEDEMKHIGEKRARPMYRLMNSVAKKIKEIDSNHPVALCNGDVLFIDIIAEECSDVDIFGTNTYRGASFTDIFDVVRDKLDKPILFTEFGADAYNALEQKEDQTSQAYYLLHNWKEIYQNASGFGKANNSIGGFTFQFSDGWWKFGFDKRQYENQHDTIATWANGGYDKDFKKGENNMNEEWFGICAKGPTKPNGLYDLKPRLAYFILQKVHAIDIYNANMNLNSLNKEFEEINFEKFKTEN